MILADRIVALAGSSIDRAVFGSIGKLAADIEQAERFVLDRDTVVAVNGVSHSSPKSIMSARTFARAPFSKTWIEWTAADVIHARGPRDLLEGQFQSERVGCLIETLPDRPLAGCITQAWTIVGDEGVEQSIICQIYDFSEDEPDLDAVTSHFGMPWRHEPDKSTRECLFPLIDRDLDKMAGSTQRHVKRDRQQRDYLADELLRYDFAPNMRSLEFAGALAKSGMVSADNIFRDWEREGSVVLSTLILLNSRNLVEREPVSQEKLNKTRRARGRPLLQSHTVLRLGAGMSVSRGGSRAEAKTHLVSGHFKVRKGGVFWWNSHVRGDGQVSDRSRYEVKSRQ